MVNLEKKQLMIANILLKIMCFLVFMCKFVYLTVDYLSYTVLIKVAPYTPIDQLLPKLSLCFAIPSLINKEPEVTFFYPMESLLNKTVGEIKRNTPAKERSIVGCSFRDWDVNELRTNLPLNECLEYFKLSKYRMHGYMCYKFEPPEMNYTFFSILHTLDHHRMLYQVAVGPPLNAGHKVCPLIHFGEYPFHDQFYSQEITPPTDKNLSFKTTYSSFELNRLPPPYETRCLDLSGPECLSKCINKHFKKYGIVKLNTFPSEEEDDLILPDFKTKYRGKIQSEIRDLASPSCRKSCQDERKCHLQLAVTDVLPTVAAVGQKLVFSVETIDSPSMLMKVSARFEFIEYFTQVTSLAGCWIGFSVFRLLRIESRRDEVKKIARKHLTRLWNLSFRAKKVLLLQKQLQRQIVSGKRAKSHGPFGQNSTKFRSFRFLSLLLSFLWRIFVLVAFAVQISIVLNAYFKYKTKTVINFIINPSTPTPNLDVCFPYSVVADAPSRPRYNYTNFDQAFVYEDSLYNQTLAELVSKALTGDQIICGCRLRDYSLNYLWNLKFESKNVCLGHFDISRYFMARKICYHFESREKIMSDQVGKKFHLHVPGIFYTLILSPKVAEKGFMTYILNYDQPPYISKEFARTDFKLGRNKFLILKTYVHDEYLKPAPYDTDCNPDVRAKTCIRECLIRGTMKSFNRLPYSVAYTQKFLENNSHLFLLQYSNLRTQEANEKLNLLEKTCDALCAKKSCFKRSTKTIVLYRLRSQFKTELGIEARAQPNTIAESVVRTPLFYVIFQILCCANFWLGFSMIYINPHHLLTRKRLEKLTINLRKKFSMVESAIRFMESTSPVYSMAQYINLKISYKKLIFGAKSRAERALSIKSGRNVALKMSRVLCVICCFAHLYYSLSVYLEYPTIMNTYSETDKTPNFQSMTICNSLLEKLTSFVLEDSAVDNSEVAGDITSRFNIREILQKSPNIFDSIVGCGVRGLDTKSKSRTNSISDRIFLDSTNGTLCKSIFKSKKYLNNGFICYVVSQKNAADFSRVKAANVLNYLKGIFTIALNATFLTKKFTVIVSKHQSYPYYSSFWSPVVLTRIVPATYEVSYVKHNLQTLPAPYSKDGFFGHEVLECLHQCLKNHLYPRGKSIFGLSFDVGFARYFSLAERKNVTVQAELKRLQNKCRKRCQAPPKLSFSPKSSFTVTKISRAFPYGPHNSIQFLLKSTEYPVVTVIFFAHLTLIELVISLGSILGIWFGFSAIQLKFVFQNSSRISVSNLHQLECKFNQAQRILGLTFQIPTRPMC